MLKSLLSLLLKENCPLCCRSADDTLCADCQGQLQDCKLENCSQFWQGDLPLFAWGTYGGELRRAIASLKYHNHPELARPLGYWLGKAWGEANPLGKRKKLTVVPIPIHPQRRKERGFNQAELLARSFCRYTGYPLAAKALKRVKATEAFFNLNLQERKEQLKEAFAKGKGIRRCKLGSPVLILDDIHTTGQTARQAAQVLNPLYEQLVGLRFRALSYLADDCDEDVSEYI